MSCPISCRQALLEIQDSTMMGFSFSKIVKMFLLGAVLMMSSMAGHSNGDDSILGFRGYGHDNWKRKAPAESSFADILHSLQRRQAETSDAIVLCTQTPVNRSYGHMPSFHTPVYRYHVLINGSTPLLCGGAVLGEYWLITSASCIEQLSGRIMLVLGFQRWAPRVGEQIFSVSRIVKHHRYNSSAGKDFDMALIRVAPSANGRGIEFTNRVQPICLPPLEYTESGSVAYLMTGVVRLRGSDMALDLYRVIVADDPRCISVRAQISVNQICATKPIYSCDGFLGGPAIYKTGGAYTLAGVVSSCPQRTVVVITSSQLFHSGFEIAD